ncbi:elongator complex protein 2-like isoform X2 [Gordionus sp. m RMFG-2023]|uniref:elongator complex protein 2-like isoform X2 n=1 Tax=Gordionus sp. m RMFG-2023 TaxID=3053472 RepID=UPI0031FD0B06
MLLSCDLLYTSAGCNNSPNIVSWSKNGLIAYALTNSIAIYLPFCKSIKNSGRIIDIYCEHLEEIVFLKWASFKDIDLLASASKEGEVKLSYFKDKHKNILKDFVCKSSQPILSMDIKFLSEHQIFLVLSSMNSDIMFNLYNIKESISHSLTYQFKYDYVISTSFIKLTETNYDKIAKLTNTYSITLEASLNAHKNWIYSVYWHPLAHIDDKNDSHKLSFISASIDESIIIWEYDELSNTWIDKKRLGAIKGLGFYGAIFDPTGYRILAHTLKGGFYMWKKIGTLTQNGDVFCNDGNGMVYEWETDFMLGGHTSAVSDIAWQSISTTNDDTTSIQYLLSVSSDQSTRLHCPIYLSEENQKVWCEVSRCQIHGYDINCIASLNSFTFATGAEEKIIRIFKCPRIFVQNLSKWTKKLLYPSINDLDNGCGIEGEKLPQTASNNPLDLTNLPIYTDESSIERNNIVNNANFSEEYPSENLLHQSTLWPEEKKLYGHGNEIFSLAYDPVNNILASACKASKPQFANIYLWDCDNHYTHYHKGVHDNAKIYKLIGKLSIEGGHSLTITQMTFSHNGRLLLSVSRDRSWNVYEILDNSKMYQKIDGTNNSLNSKKLVNHTRIIWDCSWVSGPETLYNNFITVSRDKKAILWTQDENVESKSLCWNTNKSQMILLSNPITTVDSKDYRYHGEDDILKYLVAFGLENSSIQIWMLTLNKLGSTADFKYLFDISMSYSSTIKRLRFKPDLSNDKTESSKYIIASCYKDSSVRIHSFEFTET